VPFRAGDWPDGGLPFGDPEAFTPELVAQVRRSAEDAGLRLNTVLVPSSGIDSPDPPARYRCIIDQAVALGITTLIDFGLHGDDSMEKYVAMMRAVAPYAQEKGLSISMKLHSDGDPETILDGLAAIYTGIDHEAFGLCMDPGNIIYYTAPRETDNRFRPSPLRPAPCLPCAHHLEGRCCRAADGGPGGGGAHVQQHGRKGLRHWTHPGRGRPPRPLRKPEGHPRRNGPTGRRAG